MLQDIKPMFCQKQIFFFILQFRDKDVRNRQSLSSLIALRMVSKCNVLKCVAKKNKKSP